jgi:hypothetical protein
MVERDIDPEYLGVDVDYTFTPGSMMSRQKDAVKNEMMQLMDKGLLPQATVLKHLSSAVPDVFRLEYDLQYAHARRMLEAIRKAKPETPLVPPQPQPWEDAPIHAQVFQEFMLTTEYEEFMRPDQKALIAQVWQTYTLMAQPQPAGAPSAPPPGGGAPPGAPIGAPDAGMQPAAGAEQMDRNASAAMEQDGPPGAQGAQQAAA